MAAKVWIDLKSRAAYLRRLSVAFAVELRLKIITELYMQEMSSNQFYEEFGGGSVSRVAKNFNKLEQAGWLRRVRSEGPGGRRHGGVEHFYRATELAFVDGDTWALLPYCIRLAFSWNAFKQIARRIREAMEESAFEAEPTRHLTHEPLLLDQRGWEKVIGAVDERFKSFFEEQNDARLRVCHSGEELVRASVVLIAFESAADGVERVGPQLATTDKESPIPFSARLAKVFADEVSMQLIEEATGRKLNATQFHTEFGRGSVGEISRRLKRLEEADWLRKIDEATGGKRRGAVEKFYRATAPAITDDGVWTDVPDSIKKTSGWATLEQIAERVKASLKAGTFDIRTDRYLAWSLLSLDRHGWEKVTAAVEDLLALALKEQQRAKARMKRSGEKPVAMTFALAAFEAPAESAKEP